MKSIVQRRSSLSFAKKLSRLAGRLHEPQWRRYGATVLAGKVAGVALTLAIMAGITALLFTKVYAAETTLKAADVINPINPAWTLIAAHVRMSHVHAVVAADVFPEIAMQEEDVAGAVHYVIDGQGEPMATYLNTAP